MQTSVGKLRMKRDPRCRARSTTNPYSGHHRSPKLGRTTFLRSQPVSRCEGSALGRTAYRVVAFTGIVFVSVGSLALSSDWRAFATRRCSTCSARVYEPSLASPAVHWDRRPAASVCRAERLKARIELFG